MTPFLRLLPFVAALAMPFAASAQDDPMQQVLVDVTQTHILPGYRTLAQAGADLAEAAAQDCTAGNAPLTAAYHQAFDAWIAVSHLRFGPAEDNDRAYALAFWPDTRGFTPSTLRGLIDAQDPVAETAQDYVHVSIAARGLYPLEFMLFDPELSTYGDAVYRCMLVQTMTTDIAALTADILTDWENGYAEALSNPTADGRYRTPAEGMAELFKALNGGLQFTGDTRLGRPLGTFDRPRPTRAETWRSGRSLRNVQISLAALEELGLKLAQVAPPELTETLTTYFEDARAKAELDDPVFAGVDDPMSRFRVEILQQAVARIRTLATTELGPVLGIAAGFNSIDGD